MQSLIEKKKGVYAQTTFIIERNHKKVNQKAWNNDNFPSPNTNFSTFGTFQVEQRSHSGCEHVSPQSG